MSGIQEGGCVGPPHHGALRLLWKWARPLELETLSLTASGLLLTVSLVAGQYLEGTLPAVLAGCGATAAVVATKTTTRLSLRLLGTVLCLGCLAAALLLWRV